MSSAKPSVKKNRRWPGLRLIMVLVGLIILALPVSGLYLFRIYENELVRQTEAELIVQAALVGAMFKDEILRLGGVNYGRKIVGHNLFSTDGYIFVEPKLDLAQDDILPPDFTFRSSPYEPDPVAVAMASALEGVVNDGRRITLSSIYLLDLHGLVVGGSNYHGFSLADNYEVSEALNGHYQSVLREKDNPPGWFSWSIRGRQAPFHVFFAMPVMNGDRLVGVVYLSRTPREILGALYHERRNVVWAVALSVGLVFLVCLIVWKMILTPVKHLDAEAKAVADGLKAGFSLRPPLIVVRELAELWAVVADMAERLHRRSDYLKAFASGVSHEFKTPLTSIKGAMELLGEHGASMDQVTRSRFENNILADLDRLERLVARLLTLARAEARLENMAGQDNRTEVAALIDRLVNHYQGHGYRIKARNLQPLALAVPGDVLETVLRNLFDNSQSVGASCSVVELEVEPLRQIGVIRVRDNGPGIPPELAESIFVPFFTTRKNKGGTGLGLSLAKTILAHHRGELSLIRSESGAAFEVVLPLAD